MPPPEQTIAGTFEAKPLPIATMFPRTDYVEIDSVRAGARYAIWITTPKAYDRDPERRFPAIYSPDGNRNAAFCADAVDLGDWDTIDPFESTIQISIGYTGADSGRALAVRARDLLPPGEPLPPGVEDSMTAAIASGDTGSLLDRDGMALYLHHLQHPAGDRFLAFLTDELHPFVAGRYRIDPERTGLFGHSYGGLFATYAALQPATIFRAIGASSPGILPAQSNVFDLYRRAAADGVLDERKLHMMVATREITDPGIYQSIVGAGTVDFIRLAGSTPIAGLRFTSRLFEGETHITVKPAAFYDYLRAFYLRRADQGDEE